MCVCVCVCLCMCVSVCVSVRVCVSVPMSYVSVALYFLSPLSNLRNTNVPILFEPMSLSIRVMSPC